MLWAWSELTLAAGDYQEALRIAEQLLASPPGTSRTQPIPWLLKLKGEALAALGRLDEAAQTLKVAKDGALQQQERPLLWQIHRSLGRVYHRMKDEERAESAFAEARSVITDLSASIHEHTQREQPRVTAQRESQRAPGRHAPCRQHCRSEREAIAHRHLRGDDAQLKGDHEPRRAPDQRRDEKQPGDADVQDSSSAKSATPSVTASAAHSASSAHRYARPRGRVLA